MGDHDPHDDAHFFRRGLIHGALVGAILGAIFGALDGGIGGVFLGVFLASLSGAMLMGAGLGGFAFIVPCFGGAILDKLFGGNGGIGAIVGAIVGAIICGRRGG